MRLILLAKKFARSRDGQFALLMSLLSLPLLAAVGISIDYSYAVQTRMRLRDANDSAALYAAVEYKKHGACPPRTGCWPIWRQILPGPKAMATLK